MPDRYRSISVSLRSRLLLLTMLYVLMVASMIYIPSLANFRQGFLEERLSAAQIAALALEEAPNNIISSELEANLLEAAGVMTIIMRRQDKSLLLGFDNLTEKVDADYDLRSPLLKDLIADAFSVLDSEGFRIIRVVGKPIDANTRYVEISLSEKILFTEMQAYSNNMMLLAITISIFSGVLVYMTLHWFLVRPMRRIKNSITAFRQRPEDPGRAIKPSRRRDEIGVVERELGRMQEELRHALNHRNRLAQLGEAVSKINHDLRNILATAQLSSDVLSRIKDPRVAKTSTRLMSAIDRAISLCERTLKHGRCDEPDPIKAEQPIFTLVDDVMVSLGLEHGSITFHNEVPQNLTAFADSDQLFRVILNLARNAQLAQPDGGSITVHAEAEPDGGPVHICLKDTGPGLPEEARENLFKPFVSAASPGGSGLGLAIAREICEAHGGRLELEYTSAKGTSFIICLPSQ